MGEAKRKQLTGAIQGPLPPRRYPVERRRASARPAVRRRQPYSALLAYRRRIPVRLPSHLGPSSLDFAYLTPGLPIDMNGDDETGASALLKGEANGLAILGTSTDVLLSIKDTTTAANNRRNISINDATSPVVNSGTSPKLVNTPTGLAWSPHNLFVNSSTPATQSITLITGATYTVRVTGAGSLAGSSGASGTATEGSDLTFVATGTTGTFTKTGSLSTMQINRGATAQVYRATGASAWIGIPIDYDAATGKYALLVEPQATNPLLQSQAFGTSPWLTGSGGSGTGTVPVVTANQATAPNGELTADLVRIPVRSASTRYQVVGQTFTATASTHDISAWVKAETAGDVGKQIEFLPYDSTAYVSATAVTLTTAWQRISLTALLKNSASNALDIGRGGGGVTTDLTAVGFYIWQAQAELGSVPTSPIPAFGATVTRAADNPNNATTSIPSIASAGMVVIGARTAKGLGTQVLWAADDGTTGERYRLFRNSSGDLHFVVTDGSVDQADINLGAVANDTAFTVAVSWAANSIKASLNGGTVTTDSSATLPTVTTIRHGTDHSGNGWNGRILKELLVPRVPANDTELQSIQARVA